MVALTFLKMSPWFRPLSFNLASKKCIEREPNFQADWFLFYRQAQEWIFLLSDFADRDFARIARIGSICHTSRFSWENMKFILINLYKPSPMSSNLLKFRKHKPAYLSNPLQRAHLLHLQANANVGNKKHIASQVKYKQYKIVVVMSSTCFHLKWIVPRQKFLVLWHLSKQQIQCNLAKRPKYVETENSGEAICFLYCFFSLFNFDRFESWLHTGGTFSYWATFTCISYFFELIIMNYKAKEHHHHTESIAKDITSERWQKSITENMLKRAKQLFVLKV